MCGQCSVARWPRSRPASASQAAPVPTPPRVRPAAACATSQASSGAWRASVWLGPGPSLTTSAASSGGASASGRTATGTPPAACTLVPCAASSTGS